MAYSSSLAASSSSTLEKHDVFISFRGDDTRRTFTSHLYADLCRKKIKTFIDSYDLERGENISQALLQAIEESTIWVIIFSENYASSRWCLDELVKIVKCMKMNTKTRVAIPVFYNVDPSHVRHQSESYSEAFAIHKHGNADKVEEWKVALTETANLSGRDSKIYSTDVELIEAIVGDVLKILSNLQPSDSKLPDLFGIEEKIEEIESLMSIESADIRMIGIWGMGGIGKTTIAGAVYNKLSIQFEDSCFMESVRKKIEKGESQSLRNQLFSELLGGEKVNIGTPHVDSNSFIIKRLQRKKVLIVLDDVNDSRQLDYLVGDHCWFGIGSKIIVTTRDKQVFGKRVDQIYEVGKLEDEEALALFCLNAFNSNQLTQDYKELGNAVLDYAKGVPLALKVLGSLLYGKSIKEWKSALSKLKKNSNVHIQNVLELSYDSLDHEEKEIFLDIAHFFKDEEIFHVKTCLDGCGYSSDIGMKTLLGKSLITISSDNIVSMHDLIQEMGYEVVRQEHIDKPKKRSRLRDPESYDVLKSNKGTDAIKGISMEDRNKIVHLRPDTFASMDNLRILMLDAPYLFRHIFLSEGLESLPDELRVLFWPGYPLKSLPSSAYPKQLVTLNLSRSNIEKLWDGNQELPNLKTLELNDCENLIELPDFSLSQNLTVLLVRRCPSLVHVPSSIEYLQKIFHLCIVSCPVLETIPSNIHLESLKEFSVASNIVESLCLAYNDIEEISPSTDRYSVVDLDLSFLKIPGNQNEVMDCLVCLEGLTLSFSINIQCIPTSIKNLSRLRRLYIDGLYSRESLPQFLSSLVPLIASDCKAQKAITSSTLGKISQDSMEYTTASRYDPQKEKEIYQGFENCMSLDQITRNHIVADAKLIIQRVAYISSRQEPEEGTPNYPLVCICLPGTEIPEWFSKRTTGSPGSSGSTGQVTLSSITIQLPPAEWDTLLYNPKFLGFALCSVIEGNRYPAYYVYLGGKLVSAYSRDTCSSPTLETIGPSDHVMMNYVSKLRFPSVEELKDLFNQCPEIKLEIENATIKEVGVSMVYEQDQDSLLQGIETKGRDESELSGSGIGIFDKEEEGNKRKCKAL
ncbi:Disease resistance protein (TIR-NBS-LRR class) [Quillaja saponaria]|uniref:ADP-ribosyl cyclase/cyclic ADP-ribose hydrolase n=1 Tax=Quillaja saponaria TaxID=32244 RepID=A0AAD7LQX7_QUISA|nr:Disease resistance protein (TIR-NBS-LRR class) [Quillaja saponaria]